MQSLSLGEDYGNWSMETVAKHCYKVPLYIACGARGRLGRIFWIASGANFGSLRGVAPGANC